MRSSWGNSAGGVNVPDVRALRARLDLNTAK